MHSHLQVACVSKLQQDQGRDRDAERERERETRIE